MPFGRGSIVFRLLLISDGNFLVIRASARRFDLLFKAGRLDRPFGRATAQSQNSRGQKSTCTQNQPSLIHAHRLLQSLVCELIGVPTIQT
jgi:hypothetical protein